MIEYSDLETAIREAIKEYGITFDVGAFLLVLAQYGLAVVEG